MQLSKDLQLKKRPETMLEIRKKVILLEALNKLIIQKSFKDFTNQRKKTNRGTTFLNIETINETFQQSGKQESFRHILKVQLVYINIQDHSSQETPVGYNQNQTTFANQG